MDGWRILIYGVLASWGTLLFLKMVADDLELAGAGLRQFEASERRARKKRLEAAAEARAQAAAEEEGEVEVIGKAGG